MAKLPTDPPHLETVSFADTSFYHWPQFSANISERGVPLTEDNFTRINGPTLFKDADFLVDQQVIELIHNYISYPS